MRRMQKTPPGPMDPGLRRGDGLEGLQERLISADGYRFSSLSATAASKGDARGHLILVIPGLDPAMTSV